MAKNMAAIEAAELEVSGLYRQHADLSMQVSQAASTYNAIMR